jgi:hypothetical protein
VPIYSTCSSLQNLQTYRSPQLPVMVLFSCCAYAANKGVGVVLPGRTNIVSAAGALVIGTLGNVYSRLVRGTAFTSMVTGVLFLVPVSLLRWLSLVTFSLTGMTRSVCAISRRRPDPVISQLSRAILDRILTGTSNDSSRDRRHHWSICRPARGVCHRNTQNCRPFRILDLV